MLLGVVIVVFAAARILLKDYVNGKLLYCHPPPPLQQSPLQQSPPTIETTIAPSLHEEPIKGEEEIDEYLNEEVNDDQANGNSNGDNDDDDDDDDYFTDEEEEQQDLFVDGNEPWTMCSPFTVPACISSCSNGS